MKRRHCLITGTGRAGTTFLMRLLTTLGRDTGFGPGDFERNIDPFSQGGMELDIRNPKAPYIVKSPHFCDQAEDVLMAGEVELDHVFIPIRDLDAAASSRARVTQEALRRSSWLSRLKNVVCGHITTAGGLWKTTNPAKQKEVLSETLYGVLLALAPWQIPVTLIHYPRLLKDADYLYAKLRPVLADISAEEFRAAHAKVVDLRLAHQFNEKDV